MTSIIALVLKYLPVLIQASQSIPEITGFIASLQAIFKRDKSWTPEQEAEFDAQTEAMRSDPAWQVLD
jgi:hypothetical protein